jgi:hypothetical protein
VGAVAGSVGAVAAGLFLAEDAGAELVAADEVSPAGTPLTVLPVGSAELVLSQSMPPLALLPVPVELLLAVTPERLLRPLFAAIYAAAPIATRQNARAM